MVLFLAFASCKWKWVWLPFIQAAFKNQNQLHLQWPRSAFSRCVWFCGSVPSLTDTTVAKMIGGAPSKPQRQSKPGKVKRYLHFRATIGFTKLKKIWKFLVWAEIFWKVGLLRRCQHLSAAHGASRLPWLSQNAVKQCFIEVLFALWFRYV